MFGVEAQGHHVPGIDGFVIGRGEIEGGNLILCENGQ